MRCSPPASLLLLVSVPALAIFLLANLGIYGPTPRPIGTYLVPRTGQVRDDRGPVAGAMVRFKGTARSVVSGADGRFQLARHRLDLARVTAWKDGYFIAGASPGFDPLRLELHRLPETDHVEYEWVNPAPDPRGAFHCANCHGEIYREWNESGHARSVTSRQFRDLYTGEGGSWGLLAQHPEGRGVCAACHAPTVKPGDPALFRLDRVTGVGAKGVHCDYCHKISAPREGEIGLAHGRDGLILLRPRQGQLFFGPLDDVDRGEDVYSAFYRDSRYCASCHEGIVFGVPVYSTWSEWLESPARQRGEQCQDCHMKPTGRLTNFAPGKGGVERDPRTLANHRFFAGSREEMLRHSLQVTLERRDEHVTVAIRAEGVGHRVPTGFIDRHLVLIVEGRDAAGRPSAALAGPGLPRAAGAELEGQPGRLFAKILKDEQGRSPAPFWKALPDPEDTRLRPDQTERIAFRFASGTRSIRVRILYRRFWVEVERAKGWPSSDLVAFEREWKWN